jgi:hypothetical protein
MEEERMVKVGIIVCCLLSLALAGDPGAPVSFAGGGDGPVCYFEKSNKVHDEQRTIEILVDPLDFSVSILRPVMDYFFRRYPEPETLSVFVGTSRSQFALADTDEHADPYPSGYCYRDGQNELIRYSLPGQHLRTWVIRGRDPMDLRELADKDFRAEDKGNEPAPLSASQASPKPVCYFLDLNEENAGERTMQVFLNEAEIGEDNLKVLAKYLFDRYPEPRALKALVVTNEDVLAELQGAWMRGKKPSEAHPYATLYRDKKGETIRYKLPGSDFKAIRVGGGGDQ